MFDHVTIRASDRAASQRFYATVLATLGRQPSHDDDWYAEWRDFSLGQESPDRPTTRGLHLGFAAPDRAHVDAFWQAGTAAGYRSDGEPGPRPEYGPDSYGGFLLDPDGNSAEAMHHGSLRDDGGIVHHIRIRVRDVVAFPAPEEAVRAFHADLVGAGYRDEGPPGERPIYHPGYYGAFVRDPDGNVIELVDHHR